MTVALVSIATLNVTEAAISKQKLIVKSDQLSEIRDHNYICMHVTKPEALVFKTSIPQKIWRTTIDRTGQITKGKAFELSHIAINGEAIEKVGQLASMKGQLAKNYEIKGYFAKDTDGDLPLTVVSTYLPGGTTSQIKDKYNCEAELPNKIIQLGLINKE